jgi:hypothetical protein
MRLALVLLVAARLGAATSWESGFRDPAAQYGMGVYWWWFGPAVTRAEAARELEVMSRARISYALIFPIYPISPDDPARGIRNLPYLSPEFLDVLGYTVRTAKQMGITVDLLLGTGWPYGGPSISPKDGARRLRVEPPRGSAAATGTLVAEVGGLRFFDSPTAMLVKRPALGAEGLVMDHLNRDTVLAYLEKVGGKLLGAVGGGARSLHSDSMEVFGTEWTGALLDEFRRRRGYDLTPHLPALVSDSGPLAADVRHDYWRTVSEIANDNYVRTVAEWCRRHNVTLQAESYGSPPVDMTSFQHVDHPMGESYDWKMFVASRWASSAAHQYGKRVTSAEAYTWLRYPRYVSTLQDIKLGSDLHFLCGINKLVAHGYAYSPPAAGIPGWGYYASVMLNDNNTFWPYFPLLSDYVRRVSYALSLGRPRVDVALYLPEDDVMADQRIGRGLNLYMTTKYRLGDGKPVPEFGLPAAYQSESPVIKTILTNGFSLDGFDRSILQDKLDTSRGRLEVGDVAYRIVVLPNLRGVTLPILERLAAFCRAGGTVIATRRLPDVAYGVMNREANHARLRALVSEIFGEGDAPRRHQCGKGEGIYVADDTQELARVLATLRPEIRLEPADPDLYFLHRGEGERDVYFVVNTSDRPKRVRPAFRDAHGRARLWDPMDGAIRNPGTGTQLDLELEPYGSALVVFDPAAGPAPRRETWRESGEPVAVAGPWTVTFGTTRSRIDALESWTRVADRRYYSGRGDYRTEIEIPSGPRHWRLDLGEVREIADVKINGKPAGVRWKLPYTLDVTSLIKPGRNVIEVGVTNLLINRVLGEPTPDYSALKPLRFPEPTEKKSIPEPLPSGLLGPVRLIPFEVVP